MKKGKAAKNTKMILRIVQKQWRKHGFPTPSQQAEAEAKIDRKFAHLKEKADELPALRAELEQLREKLRTEQHRIAMLAAQLQVAYDVEMDEAVELAIKQLQAVSKKFSVPNTAAPTEKTKTEALAQDGIGISYKEFVMRVSGLKKQNQAEARFEEYLLQTMPESVSDPVAWLGAKLAYYRAYGKDQKLKQSDAERLKRGCSAWWEKEKRKRAKKGGKARQEQLKQAKKKRICPECGWRELEPRKRLCRYCAIRAKVSGVSYSQDEIEIVKLSDSVQAKSGKTPKRGAR